MLPFNIYSNIIFKYIKYFILYEFGMVGCYLKE
jgi:hypothetical protein